MSTTTITCLPTLSVSWQPWQQAPITSGGATVFRLKLTDNTATLSRWYNLLSPKEQQRCTRFGRTSDRDRFVFGRGLFRLVASQITGQSPYLLTIDTMDTGKPVLTQAPNWHFSVSHTGEWVLLAVAKAPVGVDVEYVDPKFTYQDLILSVLTVEEQQAMTESTNVRLLFYELWTRKEALVKATSTGITDNFMNIPALRGRHTTDSQLIGSVDSWVIQPFFVTDAYPAALAIMRVEDTALLRFHEVDPNHLSEWVAIR